MSSFHKPKLYRTLDGCCICKAKSSSSRFTSSAKYEDHFRKCFHLAELRHGEICNACVLLVKRFKKLPPGSGRHWGHVVDARAGPGVKNFVRERRRESCRERCFKKKHVYKKKPATDSETEEVEDKAKVTPEESINPSNNQKTEPPVSDFIDLNIWKRRKVCCGTIFVGPLGEAILDPRFITACKLHSKNQEAKPDPASVNLPKIDSPLFTIEKIIESELRSFSQSSSTSEEELSSSSTVSVSPGVRSKGNRFRVGQSDADTDEGFYDKPSISPTNSID